jgi:hypothetical protein
MIGIKSLPDDWLENGNYDEVGKFFLLLIPSYERDK